MSEIQTSQLLTANSSQTHTLNAALLSPHPILTLSPKLHITFETHACKYATFARSADMMAAERMRLLQDLHFGKRIFVRGTIRVDASSRDRGVDSNGRRSGCGDELGRRDGEGVDVCWVGLRDGVGLEVLF